MKKQLFVIITLLLSPFVRAEWTGDKAEGMHSNMVISNFHTGQIDGAPYFCIEGRKPDQSAKYCSIKGRSRWGASYATFYDQAMYYYTTGQKVRIFYEPNVWTYDQFVNMLSSNALVGFSTCESHDKCFDVERKSNKK